MSRGPRIRIAEGIYQDGTGRSAVVSVGSGTTRLSREKRYPHDTLIKTMKAWQVEVRAQLQKRHTSAVVGTLKEEAVGYLADKAAELVSMADRTRDLEAWFSRFGHRRLTSLQTAELDAQLRFWRRTLSASSVNHRRDALSDLFHWLDPEGTNPVKAAVWFQRPDSVPKGIDRGRIWRVLEDMDPDRKTRWRLSLMHWTGMRPSQMGRLQSAEDFYLDDRAFELEVDSAIRLVPAVLVPSGKGGAPVLFPLGPEGVAVARGFLRTEAFGGWSCPSAYKRIVAHATRLKVAPFNVYVIKHSFAAALRRTGTDLADIQDMLGHADISSTRIYAPAVQAKHVEAIDRLRAAEARRLALADGTPQTSPGSNVEVIATTEVA